MFASNTSHSAEQPDAQFNYVTMLLPGNGTNGAQNNTFLDASTNNFTITRNGNTTQGTFSPYGDLWSNYFDGTGDYLTAPNNAAFDFGSGDLTIEAWIFPTANAPVFDAEVLSYGQTTTLNGWHFGLTGSGTVNRLNIGLNYSGYLLTSTGTVPLNTWSHVAATRSGTTWRLFINGVQDGTTTSSTNPTVSGSSICYIGSASYDPGSANRSFTGYISNARVLKGTALYTSNFTPSTAPLTAITNTSLLTCQSNRFIDNSSNNFTITRNGDVSVQRFSPFSPSAAYSAATVGGSGYFDGTGDYLSVPDDADFDLLSGTNWTLECWIYKTTSGRQAFFASNTSSGETNFQLEINSSNQYSFTWVKSPGTSGADVYSITSSGTVVLNQWNHVAAVNNSGTVTMYVNGSSVGTVSISGQTYVGRATGVAIGNGSADGSFNPYTGFIASARMVVGTAVYTSTFTPPTAPLTAITNTQLLCNFTNAGIIDNAMMNDLETVGNAQISTAQSKFGGGSISLSASGNTLRTQYNNPSLSIGSGDFTIEGWVYFSSTPSTNGVFQMSGTSGGFAPNQTANLALATNSSTTWQIYAKNTFTVSSTTTIPVGSWIHFALVRSGTTTVLYINGSSLITLTSDSTNYSTPYIGVGAIYDATSYPLAGYIDDLRITKGYARYTANFTPPAAAFPTN